MAHKHHIDDQLSPFPAHIHS